AITSPSRVALLLSLPSFCADAITLNNLVREMERSYLANQMNEPIKDEQTQYADFSQWQNELLEAEETEIGREYWRAQNLPPLNNFRLPLEKRISGAAHFSFEVLNMNLDSGDWAKLQSFIRHRNLTTSVFLETCWHILLWRLTGQPRMVIGTLFEGRKYQELEETLGTFARYLPICLQLEEGEPFSDVLKRVEVLAQEAYKWQESFTWERFFDHEASGRGVSFLPFSFEFREKPVKQVINGISWSISQQSTCIDRFNVKLSCISSDDSLTTE